MQESVLSARRPSPCPEEEDVDDESKTRKHASFAARISKHARLGSGSGSHCLVVSLSLLLLLLVACFLFSRSRPVICVSAHDSIARNALFGANLEGLATDFGSLGVPWCKPFKSVLSVFLSVEMRVS